MGVVGTSWCDFDLTFDLAVVTLSLKILSELYLGNRKVWECLYLVGTLVWACTCASSWCSLDLTFDLVVVTISLKIMSELFIEFGKA